MYKSLSTPDLSELEREFELEMDDSSELETDEKFAFETGDEFAFETDEGEFEEYEDSQDEFESTGDYESDYAERFYELSQREFESESEIDGAANELLREMEAEYFFGGLLKKAKGLAGKLAKKGMALASKAGIKLPALDALKALIGPAGDFLKGNLKALAGPALKAALSASPAGMAALPILNALGFEANQDEDASREAWNNYATVAREAFETLANNVHENIDNPLEASRVANQAFQIALKRAPRRSFSTTANRRPGLRGRGRNHKVIHIRVRPGQRVILKIEGS
jgi:hypothetical protein